MIYCRISLGSKSYFLVVTLSTIWKIQSALAHLLSHTLCLRPYVSCSTHIIHLGLGPEPWRMPKVGHIPHSYSGQHWSAFWWRRATSHGPHVGTGKECHTSQRNKQWYSLEQDLKYGRLPKKVKRAAKEYKYT